MQVSFATHLQVGCEAHMILQINFAICMQANKRICASCKIFYNLQFCKPNQTTPKYSSNSTKHFTFVYFILTNLHLFFFKIHFVFNLAKFFCSSYQILFFLCWQPSVPLEWTVYELHILGKKRNVLHLPFWVALLGDFVALHGKTIIIIIIINSPWVEAFSLSPSIPTRHFPTVTICQH